MNVMYLVGREIRFRWLGFVIGVVSVLVAIGSLTGAVTLLRAHDLRTEIILEEQQALIKADMDRMEDDYRRIMRELGHNVMILHADQGISELQSDGAPRFDMPEDYVERLGRGGITTLNHLLPVLQGSLHWPEHDLDVIVYGTPGQVPVYHRLNFLTPDGTAYRNPIVQAVPRDALNLGGGVARALGVAAGDEVVLKGKTFRVNQVAAIQGTRDDMAVWCSLDRAQAWLDRPGRINVIFALECVCSVGDLGRITEEVRQILPDVQVMEFSSRIMVRAAARDRAAETSRRAMENERRHRRRMGAERRRFATLLVPVMLAASGVWVFFLILGNVRERRTEIGIWRALGLRSSNLAGIFVLKAALIGVLGALAGYPLGVLAGAAWGGIMPGTGPILEFFSLRLLLMAVLLATLLCMLAGMIPAVLAAEYDPAETLREG